uniref:Uncharacterized protein n=1 Tax=Oryza punctata TaxID=4537 RepID=A0A0E0JZ09_ORYPU
MLSSMNYGSSSYSHQSKVSHVPYRVGPLEYQHMVMCHCCCPAKRRSGSRRASTTLSGDIISAKMLGWGCDFWVWCDGPMTSFIKELLNDLRDVVTSLMRDVTEGG